MNSSADRTAGHDVAIPVPPTEGMENADKIAHLMLEKNAADVLIMDLRGITSMTDCFVLATGSSRAQVKAIADHVDDSLRKSGAKPYHIEGYTGLAWVILDYVHVVAHIFMPAEREYYHLERLWADADMTAVEDHVP